MTRQLNQTREARARYGQLSAHMLAKKSGAEDAGDVREAEFRERQFEAAESAWLKNKPRVQNHLFAYFGAPDYAVDLERELANRCHHLPLETSTIPPALQRYVDARNDRVKKSQKWSVAHRSPEALVWELVRLTRSASAPRRGSKYTFAPMMTARKKEILALNEAIEDCINSDLAITRSGQVASLDLRSDPSFIRWHLGHVDLLRDFATQDLETTQAQRDALSKVIVHFKSR